MAAELIFYNGPMYTGKTTDLLTLVGQYQVAGRTTLAFVPKRSIPDPSVKPGDAVQIKSRICNGIDIRATVVGVEHPRISMVELTKAAFAENAHAGGAPQHIVVDEAQFLDEQAVSELEAIVDRFKIPVSCFGLRTDFLGALFEGSRALFERADRIVEKHGLCNAHSLSRVPTRRQCKRGASCNVRVNADGAVVSSNSEPTVDTHATYASVCRYHHRRLLGGVRASSGSEITATSPVTSQKRTHESSDDEGGAAKKSKKEVSVEFQEECDLYGVCSDCEGPDTGYCKCTAP